MCYYIGMVCKRLQFFLLRNPTRNPTLNFETISLTGNYSIVFYVYYNKPSQGHSTND